MRKAAVLIGAASLALAGTASLAWAEPTQPNDDPIGDLLSGLSNNQGMDDDAAESADSDEPIAAASPSAPSAPAYTPPAPFAPSPPVSRLPQLDRPVMIDELGRTPEAPPTASEQTYESRIRGGFNSAQGLQGPLDGGWVVRGSDGRPLYGLQLVDRGSSGLEGGAFRSLRRDQAAGHVGLIESVDKMADGSIQLRFRPRGVSQGAVVTLRPVSGGWAGDLWEGGSTRPVSMRRQ